MDDFIDTHSKKINKDLIYKKNMSYATFYLYIKMQLQYIETRSYL